MEPLQLRDETMIINIEASCSNIWDKLFKKLSWTQTNKYISKTNKAMYETGKRCKYFCGCR